MNFFLDAFAFIFDAANWQGDLGIAARVATNDTLQIALDHQVGCWLKRAFAIAWS
jgi:hypothetical protein